MNGREYPPMFSVYDRGGQTRRLSQFVIRGTCRCADQLSAQGPDLALELSVETIPDRAGDFGNEGLGKGNPSFADERAQHIG